MLGHDFQQREPGTECHLVTVSKRSNRGSSGSRGDRERTGQGIIVFPLIDPAAYRKDPRLRKVERVLSKITIDQLAAAGKGMCRWISVCVDNLVTQTSDLLHFGAGYHRLQFAEIARPLEPCAEFLRRDSLQSRQRLAVAIRSDCREALVITLSSAESA